DFAGKKPNVIARVGTYPWDDTKLPRGAVSTDGGATWQQFGSEPKDCEGMGSVAVSADGSVLMWAPRGAHASYSRDAGNTWVKSEGLRPPATTPEWAASLPQMASDGVTLQRFCGFDALSGSVYVSQDKGAHVEVPPRSQRAVPGYELQSASIVAVPDHEGDA